MICNIIELVKIIYNKIEIVKFIYNIIELVKMIYNIIELVQIIYNVTELAKWSIIYNRVSKNGQNYQILFVNSRVLFSINHLYISPYKKC